jgi:hypothetical protein
MHLEGLQTKSVVFRRPGRATGMKRLKQDVNKIERHHLYLLTLQIILFSSEVIRYVQAPSLRYSFHQNGVHKVLYRGLHGH